MLAEAQYNLLHPDWLDITQFNVISLFKKKHIYSITEGWKWKF